VTEKPNSNITVALIRVFGDGRISLSDFSKCNQPENPRLKILISSLMERFTKEWATVKSFSDDEVRKMEYDGTKLIEAGSHEPCTLALQNVLRTKENLDEIERAYR